MILNVGRNNVNPVSTKWNVDSVPFDAVSNKWVKLQKQNLRIEIKCTYLCILDVVTDVTRILILLLKFFLR